MAGENNDQAQQEDVIFGEVTDKDMFFGDPLPVEPEVKKEEQLEEGEDPNKGGEEEGGKPKPKSETDELLENLELTGEEEQPGGGEEASEEEAEASEEDGDIDYTALVEHLVASGEWMDFELEEGETLEDLTKEEFEEIRKQQRKAKLEKDRNDLYANVSETDKEFLEFINNGGTKDQYLQTYLAQKQASELDISEKVGQQKATYAYYKNFVGWDDKRIQKHMSGLSEEELKDEAQLAKTKIEEVAKERHQARLDAVKEQAEAREQAKTEYKQSLKTTLKESGLDTKESNVIIKAVTEEDKRGYTAVDIAYLKMKNDPEKVANLHRFLTDYEGFVKEVSQKKVNDERLRDFTKLKYKRKKTDKTSVSSSKKKKGDGIFITLD